ncbi:MAG: redox-sensing transcriptional repressor Rex [Chitinivibrionales bacterium]|nr:redox-sensing transcriptional repressor Rex [Chitinivibrionales bacterium]MBD3356571.1 redox-sensing transcriptional repressor Rex [Chitinivibrionales bacterium]
MVRKNRKVISRLSRYKNALNRFQSLGFVKIFSDYLAEAVGVTSSQVRKDFSLFGIHGNKRGGYQIDALLERLNEILGKNELQRVILVGAGNLGSALIKYKNFEKDGVKIVAAFDIDPAKHGDRDSIPVLPLDDMQRFIAEQGIKTAILAVPDVAAQPILDRLTSCGIKGVLNFAPIQLKAEGRCVVNHVNLELELENLIYFVNAMEKTGDTGLGN